MASHDGSLPNHLRTCRVVVSVEHSAPNPIPRELGNSLWQPRVRNLWTSGDFDVSSKEPHTKAEVIELCHQIAVQLARIMLNERPISTVGR